MNDWKFRIRAFAGSRHGMAPLGVLLFETVHGTESSAAVEIDACKSRMKRGEIEHAELIDLRPQGRLTNLNISENTIIPWSWILNK